MSRHVTLLKNTAIVFLGRFATQFISLLLLPLYTHFLSTSDYGTVDLIVTYISLFAPAITLQQEMATFRYLIDARGDKRQIDTVISSSVRGIFYGLIAFMIPYAMACVFIDFDFKLLILLNIICCSIANFLLQSARGLGQNINYAVASTIAGVATLISNIFLITEMHLGAESILFSMMIANIICAVYLTIALKIPKYLSLRNIDRSMNKAMLRYSLPLVPNGISWWIINASDRTIVSLFLGVAANGIYAAANKISTITSGLVGVFSLSWTESASLHINDADRDEFFSSVINNTVKLFSFVCAFAIAIIPPVFNLLIGSNYADAYAYIPIFIVSSIFNCIVVVYSAIYVAKKLTKKVASTSIIAATINILINLIFVNYIGLYAAAFSTLIAFFAMATYRHFDLKKYVNIRYKTSVIVPTISILIFAIVAYYVGNLTVCVVAAIAIAIFAILSSRPEIARAIQVLSSRIRKK